MTAQDIESISLIIQAVSTVVLVGVSIYYGYQSNKIASASEQNSKLDFLPVIVLGYSRPTNSSVQINLENAGKGIARKPKIFFPGLADKQINSLMPGERSSHHFSFNIEQLLNLPDSSRKVRIEYNDIFSRTIKTEALVIRGEEEGENGKSTICFALEKWHVVLP